jgi:hypothetical protein
VGVPTGLSNAGALVGSLTGSHRRFGLVGLTCPLPTLVPVAVFYFVVALLGIPDALSSNLKRVLLACRVACRVQRRRAELPASQLVPSVMMAASFLQASSPTRTISFGPEVSSQALICKTSGLSTYYCL